MKIKKIIWIPLLVIVLILLTGWIGLNHLRDNPENPISYALAEAAAKQYVKNNLPDSAYEVRSVSYFDKDDIYYVTLAVPDSRDNYFSLGFNHIGTLRRNNYEYMVLQKATTAIRISDEYNAAVKNALPAPDGTTDFVCVGNLKWKTADVSAVDPGHIISNELQFDDAYPPTSFGAQAGHIWFRVNLDSAEQVNPERMAEILLYIREKLDTAGIPFHTISASFQCSKPVIIANLGSLLYEEITPEGLEGRIEEALIP